MPRCRFVGAGVALLVVVALRASVVAAAPFDDRDSPAGYAVTAWTFKDGLPSANIVAMTQDRDGYLWLGTTDGLIRFDGFQFMSAPAGGAALPGTLIAVLKGARDGSVWIGFDDVDGVSRILNGRVTEYHVRDGLPTGVITVLLETHDGAIWAGGVGGVSVYRAGRWGRVGSEVGLPPGAVFSLHEDRAGNIWAGTAAGVYLQRAADHVFRIFDDSLRFAQSLAEDRNGGIWTTSENVVRRLGSPTHHDAGPVVRLPGITRGAIADHRGALWITGLGEGLFRIAQPLSPSNPFVERFHKEPKFSAAARSLFEDREHNLWVGMRGGGLLRLSESAINTQLPLKGLTNDGVRAVATTPNGTVWVATGHGLNAFSKSGATSLPVDQPIALHTDRHGVLWVVTAKSLARVSAGRLVPVSSPPGVHLERTIALTTDANGAVWLCNYDDGVLRWDHRTLTRFDELSTASHHRCNFLFTDSHDRVWVGLTTGGAAVYDNGRFEFFDLRDGLAAGSVATIYEDRAAAIWIVTVSGLTRIRNHGLTTIAGRNGLPGKIVPSFVEDQRGDFWLGTEAGTQLIRFAAAEADRIATDPSHQLQYESYDESDGLLGPLPRIGRPSAVRADDGTLWVFSGGGIAVIDPMKAKVPKPPPVPRVERVSIDGDEMATSQNFVMSPSARILQIDYGAVSLSTSRLRFRYRLEGLADDWVESGSRRQISYTNIRPGRYRFQVGVTTDGRWITNTAGVGFVVQPPFYATGWFYALVIVTTGIAGGLCWWLRLRAIRSKFALVVAERARVSREIHDTLLQSLGALTLQLEVVSRQLDPSQAKAQQAMQRLRKNVARCVQDARRSVWELRSLRLEESNLVEALGEMADETMVALPVTVRVDVNGRVRSCTPDVEQHLLRIAQEAISNAVQHGSATEVFLELSYAGDSLTLSVRDNGRGFTLEHVVNSGDHWGLVNMRERMARIGGRLLITSELGQGTVITAVTPL